MHIRIIPNEIIKATGGRFAGGIGLTMIESVCIDSRKTTSNCLFVPLKGTRRDGHRFIEDALSKGAVATLVGSDSGVLAGLQKKYKRKILIEVDDTLTALGNLASLWRYKFTPELLIVTGSSGVSETGRIADSIIGEHRRVLTNPLSGNRLQELPLTLMKLNAEHEAVLFALEMDQPGELKRLADICEPTAVLITGTQKQDRKEQAELLRNLHKNNTAILNSDNPQSAGLKKVTKARVLTFGLKKGDICAENVRRQKDGRTTFTLKVRKKTVDITMTLPEDCTLQTVLGSAAIACLLDIDIADIKRGLES